MTVKDEYTSRFHNVLGELAMSLEEHLAALLVGIPRIDRVSSRAKSPERFLVKSKLKNADGTLKYSSPLNQIQDQLAARITVFYKIDVEEISKLITKNFRFVEQKLLIPPSEWQFGYFGKHFVCLIPDELLNPVWNPEHIPQFFELQIKTLFQHAWSEANHDLGYKLEAGELSENEVRMLAFTSAQAWGADQMFADLFDAVTNRNQVIAPPA